MRTTEMSMEKMIKGLQMVRSNHEGEVMVSLEHGEIGVFDLVHNVILALGKVQMLENIVDRPCEGCKFHGEDGCKQWKCVWDDVIEENWKRGKANG